MATSDIPLPPFATEGVFNGAFETRIDLAAAHIRDHLAGRYGPIEIAEAGDFVPLADSAGWPEVEAFYARAFASPPLDGFARQPDASPDPSRYQLAVWARGNEAVGVALVPGGPDDPLPFLLRFRATRS